MRQKLKIDPKVASVEDFHNARRSPTAWMPGHKIGILEGICLNEDTGFSRKQYAAANIISPRTLQRWIHQVNTGGLAGALEPVQHRPGRKRKVGLQEFRERILPMAEEALHRSGIPNTIKNLYEAAQSLGLVDASYATFRRRLQQTSSSYKRRKVEPTYDEWMFHTQTGRWPRRLKSFGRRRAKEETLAWQRMREDCQQELARWKAEAAAA
jgi:transposase